MKGLNIESFFPHVKAFYRSANCHIANKAKTGLTNQEVYRREKTVIKGEETALGNLTVIMTMPLYFHYLIHFGVFTQSVLYEYF